MAGLRFAQRARHFAQRDRFVKFWFLPAWLGLGLASLAIALVAFRRIAPVLGVDSGTSVPELAAGKIQEARALQIRRTIELAARYAPWRADCYPQAIVARLLLGLYRVPFVLCLGLARDSATGAMTAHAWVRSGGVAVTGGIGEADHRIVRVFASR